MALLYPASYLGGWSSNEQAVGYLQVSYNIMALPHSASSIERKNLTTPELRFLQVLV
jgi:hypothetical protein